MLTISGLKNFYYILGMTDMHCGYSQKACLTMEDLEKNRYIEYFLERLDEDKRARELSDERLEGNSATHKEAEKHDFDLLGKIDRIGEEYKKELQILQSIIEDVTSAIH